MHLSVCICEKIFGQSDLVSVSRLIWSKRLQNKPLKLNLLFRLFYFYCNPLPAVHCLSSSSAQPRENNIRATSTLTSTRAAMRLPFGNRRARLSSAVSAIPISCYAPAHTRPLRPRHLRFGAMAAIIPGDSVLETTTVGGTATFFSIYQNVIGNALVRPIITVCDPYLNLFRNVVPPIFGLDLSPVLAMLLLQAFGSATTALGVEMKPGANKKVLSKE